MKKAGIFIVFILFFQTIWADAYISKVINLSYKNANDVIALVKPILKPGEEITGSGQTLVVKVSPDTLTQLRTILHSVDVPPVVFEITIFQGPANWLDTRNDMVISTHSNVQQQRSQSVKVNSGESAFISTGQDVPVVSSVGVGFFTGVSYDEHHVQKGLFVQPQLQGSQVKLNVKRVRSQENSALQNQGQFQNQDLTTTVMVPLNKWVSLGSAQDAPVNQDSDSEVIQTGNQFTENATLFVKVGTVGG